MFPDESGGEGGIRTHDTLNRYNTFAGCRFQPLSHLSDNLAGVQGIEPCLSGLESDVQPVTLHPYGAGMENRTPSFRLET